MRFLFSFISVLVLLLLSCSNNVDSISYEGEDIGNNDDENSVPALPALNLDIPESGFYKDGVSFEIPADVYCGRSGAVPTTNSSVKPNTMVTFEETGILRCAKFQDGKAITANLMRTYFIGESAPTLPIVSIVTEPKNIESGGIYSSSCNHNNLNAACYVEPPAPIHIDFFEPDGEFSWSAPGAFEIMGGWSRDNPKKSVKVALREKYGQKNINYPLFPAFGTRKYKDFVLRNGGNNWDRDYIRDRLAAELMEGTGVDYMKGRYVIVYYNGNYWGIHDMRERANKNYFDTNYGIEESQLNLFKNYTEVKTGSDASYWEFIAKLEKSTDVNANYELIKANIDIENFTNYFISQIYFDNRDWPGNNIRMWKSNVPGAKWKYFLFDVDFGFGGEMYYGEQSEKSGDCSMIELVTSTGSTCTRDEDDWPVYYKKTKSTIILVKLLQNPTYKNYFIERVNSLLATNFEPTTVKAKVDELMSYISSEIPKDKARWGYDTSPTNNTLKGWVDARPENLLDEIDDYFSTH